jgi:RNA polymerase sigma factor for flagellar operon FliA
MPLVRYVVKKCAGTLPLSFERDDLIDSGVCGLIEAVERYDPAKNTKFETYAILRIRGAVLDELRSRDWKPRSLRRKAREYGEVCAKLDHEEDGSLNPDKIAKALGLTPSELDKRMSEISFVSFVSMDDGQPDSEEQSPLAARIEDPRSPDPTHPIQFDEKKRALIARIKDLHDHERLVIALYYFEGLYLKEIGELLNVTESRVSQIHTQALASLKAIMCEFA